LHTAQKRFRFSLSRADIFHDSHTRRERKINIFAKVMISRFEREREKEEENVYQHALAAEKFSKHTRGAI
jgi:hypothetical protein